MKKWLILGLLIAVVLITFFILIKNPFQTLSEQQRCENSGGRWEGINSPTPSYFCNEKTSDGGKPCTDSSDCESNFCKADEYSIVGFTGQGTCYPYMNGMTSCSKSINNGIVQTASCP